MCRGIFLGLGESRDAGEVIFVFLLSVIKQHASDKRHDLARCIRARSLSMNGKVSVMQTIA